MCVGGECFVLLLANTELVLTMILLQVQLSAWVLFSIFLCTCTRSSAVAPVNNLSTSEMNALWSLYNATDGANWIWSNRFFPRYFEGSVWNFSLQANPCADHWQGITCNSSAASNYSQVTNLTLSLHRLHGTIPAEIIQLTKLRVLNLSVNQLNGSIPAAIVLLEQLQVLDLHHNKLSGRIPAEIGQLTTLQNLDLSVNSLSGSIPAEIGQLTQLLNLDLAFNELSGSIPAEIGQLTQLLNLDLASNELLGSIPAEIGQLTQLLNLDLSSNMLSDVIPVEIVQLVQLQELVLDTNHLSGSIPAEIGQLSQLQELYLNYNWLSGSIPAEIAQLAQLLNLDLSSTHLSGSIPAQIVQLAQLVILDLSFNELSGSIPAEIGQLSLLQELAMDYNKLSGSIPAEICQLTLLSSIKLNKNQLSGSIPVQIKQLTHLQNLYVDTNWLSGSIPAEIGQLQLLHYVDLYANTLSGSIPVEMGQLKLLQGVDVENNVLSGSLPAEIGQLAHLKMLYLSANKLTGSIPIEIGQLVQLQVLYLNGNEFTGSVPVEIGQLAMLLLLYLSANKLTGSIPIEIGQLAQLQVLCLDANNLSGSVPSVIGNLKWLQVLDFASNVLSGSIPAEIGQLAQLENLVLTFNELSGSIPAEIGLLTMLKYVDVASNSILGSIPGELFAIASLNSLIASSNCFHGVLPQAVCGADALEALILDGMHTARQCSKRQIPFTYLYGGADAFHGTIPGCIFDLPLLTSLHLSGNGLTGTIPANLSADTMLTDLVLSHNSLVGPIPASIQLRAWDTLDLSYNRLDGTLLSRFGGNTFGASNADAYVYLKNNRLSGRIPSFLVHLTDVQILGSNMFSCGADRSDLPVNDEDKNRYQCGSNTLIGHLVLALSALVILITVVWVAHKLPWGGRDGAAVNFARRLFDEARLSAGTLAGVDFLATVHSKLCLIAFCSAIGIVICLLPWYAAAHSQYSTYTHSYAWVVSAAFLSGLVPALTELALYCALMIAVVIGGAVTECCAHKSQRGLLNVMRCSRGSSTDSAQTPLWYQRLLHALFFVTNLTVVLLVNVGFVAASLQADQVVLSFAQVLFTAFKLYWNMVCTPYLIDCITAYTGRRRVSSSLVTVHMLLSILNNIVIPCLVVAAQSPSCFLNVFQASPTDSAKYYEPECNVDVVVFHEVVEVTQVGCIESSVPLSLQFEPHFSYSYQCSSSFITYYSPVFVLMGLTAGVLIPLTQVLSLYYLTRAVPGTRWHRVLSAAVPRILRPTTSSTPPPLDQAASPSTPAAMLRRLREERVFNGLTAVSATTTYLGILLTFGVVFPPLAVIMCATMWSSHWQTRLMLGKFVHDAQAVGAVHLIERLEQDCRSVVSLQTLRRVMFLITCICCCFYALFLFDTLGDARGAAGSYWIFLVMALFPVVLYVLSRALHAVQGKLGTTERTGSYVDDNMFEMATISPGPARELEEGSSQDEAAAAVRVSQEKDRSAVSQVAGMGEAESAAGVTMNALHGDA